MIIKNTLAGSAILIIATSLVLTACSESSSVSKRNLPTPSAQTEEERQYILANKNTVNTAAYLINLVEKYEVCKSLYSDISSQSAINNKKLAKWTAKIEQQFNGEVAQKILSKLVLKMKIKINENTESKKPLLKQCQDLHKKIDIGDITPEARKMVAGD